MNSAPSSELHLPDPDAFPQRDVVLWDGQCRFCKSQVERLRTFDGDRLSYMSLHDPRASQRYPDLSRQQLMEQMWVVTSKGARLGGADAVRYLSRTLPKLWWLAPLLHVPCSMPLWRWLYGRIATRRYRLSGGDCEDGSCGVHSPDRATQKN